ncbi:MAG TPA: MbnP family protein [Chitinophagaceae bacterium]|nr:MbnP family protein [Chitinophagaceae bacterium]
MIGAITVAMTLMAFMHTPFKRQEVTVLQFSHRVGNKPLQLFDEVYTNRFNEPFTVTKFRYYISPISITNAEHRKIILPHRYYLINEADSSSKRIELPYKGTIEAITLLLGVDSLQNVNGVHSGSLDPVNGMYWTWNSGYVFAKLEGQSDSSHAPAHGFTWDVGGFRKKENALRLIQLELPPSAANTITIKADLLAWFDAVHPLRITQSPICHQPGALATQLADNYSAMFSIAP